MFVYLRWFIDLSQVVDDGRRRDSLPRSRRALDETERSLKDSLDGMLLRVIQSRKVGGRDTV